MTPEQSTQARFVAEAKDRLRRSMARIPFDINTAGATRVRAWKAAVLQGQKVLARESTKVEPYSEATRLIEQCASAPVETLAEAAWGETKGKAA